ncbi:MAG: substrate-binding domain-containing protein, partial [Spirochaetales bacterium]|nr:substrate-binding domain-containing protein [Spirochaetales bacterium]
WCISDESYDTGAFPRSLWKFIKGLPRATALVCCNYMILNIMLELFKEKGVRVPEDFSIVCFDYSAQDWQESSITASIHPGFDMGVRVGENILKMVDDPGFRDHDYSYIYPPRIHDGSSISEV